MSYCRFVYGSPSAELSAAIRRTATRFIHQNERELASAFGSDQLSLNARSNELYAERTQVAREWMSLGIKNYQQLDIVAAVPSLVRGLESFEQYGHSFVAPNEVAELLMYLALASLENRDSDVAFALEKFRQMILLAPEREIKEGVYPQQVVQFLSFRSRLTRKKRSMRPGSRIRISSKAQPP